MNWITYHDVDVTAGVDQKGTLCLTPYYHSILHNTIIGQQLLHSKRSSIPLSQIGFLTLSYENLEGNNNLKYFLENKNSIEQISGIKNSIYGVPVMAQRLTNLTSIHEDTGSILEALLSGLRIWHCCELWCSLQTWLGFCVAVAVV